MWTKLSYGGMYEGKSGIQVVTKIDYKTEYYERIKPNYQTFNNRCPGYWLMKYQDRLTRITTLLNKTKDLSLYDIGCGLGRGLSYFKKLGVNIKGCEPSDYAYKNNRCKEAVDNCYFKDNVIKDKFDIVHIEQVLSHEPDYKSVLRKADEILKDKGVMCIEEPNDYNALQMILKKDYGEYWVVKDHANYFNFSLADELEQMGYKVEKSCTFPMELFALSGQKYIGDDVIGAEVHKKRYDLLSSLSYEMRQELKDWYASLGVGRDIVLFARKGG